MKDKGGMREELEMRDGGRTQEKKGAERRNRESQGDTKENFR